MSFMPDPDPWDLLFLSDPGTFRVRAPRLEEQFPGELTRWLHEVEANIREELRFRAIRDLLLLAVQDWT